MLMLVGRIWHRKSEKRQITRSKKKTSSNLYQLQNNKPRQTPFNVQGVNRESVGIDKHRRGVQMNLWQWGADLGFEGRALTVSLFLFHDRHLWRVQIVEIVGSFLRKSSKTKQPPLHTFYPRYFSYQPLSGKMRKRVRIIYHQPLLLFCFSGVSVFDFSRDNKSNSQLADWSVQCSMFNPCTAPWLGNTRSLVSSKE